MTATSTSRRHLFLVSGLLVSLVACGGDDSGAGNADAGTDDVFTPGPDGTTGQPDSSPGPDGTVADTGLPTGDSGGSSTDGGADAAEDTGTPDGSKPDGGGSDGGGADGGTDSGEVDAAANVPNDPIALWHFDEASGSVAYDSSGHGHTATLFGGATFAPGKHGSGLSPNASGWAMIPASLPIFDAGSDTGADADVADAGPASDASDDAGATDASATDGDAPDADAATDDASSADAGGAADASGEADAGPAFAPLVFDTTRSFSVVCWVKVYSKGPGQWQTAFSRDANHLSVFTLKLRGDNPEQFDFDFPGADDTTTGLYAVAQSATSPTVSLLDGGADYWYHLAGVLDRDPADAGAATVRIYVNGVAEATTSPTTPILAAVGDTFIGAGLFNTRSNSWNGVIDEVALYDRALTALEVGALYTTTK